MGLLCHGAKTHSALKSNQLGSLKGLRKVSWSLQGLGSLRLYPPGLERAKSECEGLRSGRKIQPSPKPRDHLRLRDLGIWEHDRPVQALHLRLQRRPERAGNQGLLFRGPWTWKTNASKLPAGTEKNTSS